MLDRRSATWEERKEQKEALDARFKSGILEAAAYILSLELLGFRESEARTELNYIRGLK